MRFALIATCAAAAAAAPLFAATTGPQMDGQEFLSAVRCAAYDNAAGAPNFAGTRYRLNSEARRQPAETKAAAIAEIEAINAQATRIENASEAAIVRSARAQACAGADAIVADGASRPDAA